MHIVFAAMTATSHAWIWMVLLLVAALAAWKEIPRAMAYQPCLQPDMVAHAEREEANLRCMRAKHIEQTKIETRARCMNTTCILRFSPTWHASAGEFVLEEKVDGQTVFISTSSDVSTGRACQRAIRSKGG